MIEEGVDRDPAQPGVKGRIRAKRSDRLVSFQPDFLRKIFGVVGVAAVVRSKEMNAPRVAFSEPAKRIEVVCLSAFD